LSPPLGALDAETDNPVKCASGAPLPTYGKGVEKLRVVVWPPPAPFCFELPQPSPAV